MSSSSSALLTRTSQRLKQLITSQSNSKKNTNHDSPNPSPNPGTQPHPRSTSRPHSWISHTSARKGEVSHSPTAANAESISPRIEPPAVPKASKGRTKSAGCVGTNLVNENGNRNESGHGILFSKSEGSLCCVDAAPDCNGKHGCAQGCEESDCSLSGRDASASMATSCRDASCKLPVPRKSSRRKKIASPTSTTPVLDLFPSPPSGLSPSDREVQAAISRRPPQLSTLDLFEALGLDPNEGLKTPTQTRRNNQQEDCIKVEHSTTDADNYLLPLSRTAWSDDVEQLIRETDKAFKAVSFALSDAKEATNDFRPINWRPDLEKQTDLGSSRKEGVRMRGKQANKTPLTRNASIKAAKSKSKKSTKGRKMALQAFPDTSQNHAPRWSLPESVFGGRMFGRLEADEMLKSEESIQHARWSRESLMGEKMEEAMGSRKRESQHSQSTMDSVETREEDRSTPLEPFHLEELSLRLSNVKIAEEGPDFETPRPSPKPPLPTQDTPRTPEYLDQRPSSTRVRTNTSHVLSPIPPYSPISPPTPSTLAVFNATAPLSPVSAISPPLNRSHDNGATDQDPFRYGKLSFPAPPVSSKPAQPQSIPQPVPHRASRSRSVTRTSLATIREASPIENNQRIVSSSMPATPAKNRSPIRSPSKSTASSGTIISMSSGQGTPLSAANSNGRGGTTLLHSALHRGFKQRPNTMPIPQTTNAKIVNAEVVSGSLSPRKITPFPSSIPAEDENIKTIAPTANGLVSTPFSLTAPLFRHGSIRLNSSKHSKSFPNSGTSTGFATPYLGLSMDGSDGLEATVVSFDWTAFQMAISGGAGDYLQPGDMDKEEREKHEEEIEREREDIYDWWRGFGFRGRDCGMGRVARSEPRKAKKGGKHQKHSKGEEEKRRRRAKTKSPEIAVAELPGEGLKRPEVIIEHVESLKRLQPVATQGDSLKRPEPMARPFSFQPGQETLTSKCDGTSSGSSSDENANIPTSSPDMGYATDDSDGPPSPMEELTEQELMAGRDVLMGRNLNHDLRGFLRWESMNVRYTGDYSPPYVDRMHTI